MRKHELAIICIFVVSVIYGIDEIRERYQQAPPFPVQTIPSVGVDLKPALVDTLVSTPPRQAQAPESADVEERSITLRTVKDGKTTEHTWSYTKTVRERAIERTNIYVDPLQKDDLVFPVHKVSGPY